MQISRYPTMRRRSGQTSIAAAPAGPTCACIATITAVTAVATRPARPAAVWPKGKSGPWRKVMSEA